MTMSTTFDLKQSIALFIFLLVFLVPLTSEARHNERYGVNTSSLGSEEVDDLPIPVLFDVFLDELTENFGDPRDGGARTHEGLDIMAKRGTPIVSPTKAIVIGTGNEGNAGKFVYTANPGGESFRYMHLDSIADIKRGDKLAAGDFIGTVGDTGNAKGAGTHLHFEVRDGREATDPFPRLTKEFTFKEQISFLSDVFEKVDDPSDYAELLAETYPSELRRALNAGYELPRILVNELKRQGVTSNVALQAQLDALINSIPKMLTRNLAEGDTSVEVALLQLYLQYRAPGTAGEKLRSAGASGFFGPVTKEALIAYQRSQKIEPTGIFDKETREKAVRYN